MKPDKPTNTTRPWCDCALCERRDAGATVARCNWDMAEGMRTAERRIVEWLREHGRTSADAGKLIYVADAYADAANHIERGEHRG